MKKLTLVMFLVIVLGVSCFSEGFSQPITSNTNITVGSTSLKARWKAFGLLAGALNINCISNNITTGYTMKIAFMKSGNRDTVNCYPYVAGNKPSWINRKSDSMFVWCLDSMSTMTFSIEQPASTYPAPSLQMNDASDGSSTADTTTYVPKYGDFTVEDTKTFRDSTVLEGKIMNRGTGTQRPTIRSFYSDVGTPTYIDVGSIGVGEFNAAINFDYSQGLHWYYDTSKAAMSMTSNLTDSIFCMQWIPKGFGNQPSQPDAWSLSGNTTPFRVNSQGFMGVIGGITSIFKTRGNPTIGTSTTNDYTDTTKYNLYGRGGKSFVDNKLGVATDKPASTFHTVNKATTRATSNYGALSDWILQDDGASDRAQLEFRSPNGSAIFFGDQSTSNLAYIQYVNSTSTLNIVGTSIVNLAGTIQENGTALTSKYSQLGASNTYTGASNTFTNKVVVGTGTSNGTADFLAMGDTITLRGTVYRDSSMFRVMVNPFSQRMKVEMLGKTGNNMFTVDSTLITSSLAMTITGNLQAGQGTFSGLLMGNTSSISWNGRSVINSGTDGNLKISNFAGNDFNILQFGGLTSLFPALKRSGTGLIVRLADDSGNAPITFSTGTISALPTYADNTSATGGGLTAGQLYKTATGSVMIVY